MRTLAISTVKNESDIIEIFVRHNLDFFDAMVIMDNGSTDGTRELLTKLEREGLPVVIFDEPDPAYRQSEWMTRLFCNAIRFFDVDWVVPLDADEFLAAPSRAEFHSALSELPSNTYGLLAWRTYIWPLEGAGLNPLQGMKFRRREERPPYKKVVIPVKVAHAQEFEILQGSHRIQRNGKKVRKVELETCWLAHYPVRSLDQLKAKILIGWLGYLVRDGARESSAKGQGNHWHKIYDQIIDRGLSEDDTNRISFNYAQEADLTAPIPEDALIEDPIVSHASERYSECNPADSLVALARMAERAICQAPDAIAETPSTKAADATEAPPRLRFWQRKQKLNRKKRVAPKIWSAEMHVELQFLDFPPFRFLQERLAPTSALDLGSGSGGYLAALRRWGVGEICAVDGFETSESLHCPDVYLQHDLENPLDLGRHFDLVICMEVIEHLDASREDILIDSIERHARDWILFSGADLNQPGRGHVNCRPISHWLDSWEKRGFIPDPFASLAFRSLATFTWFRRNPILLARRGTKIPVSAFTTEDLLRLAETPYPWFGQQPTTHEFPLRAPLPPEPG